MIIIIAGPSGAGKTTLCKMLVENMDNIVYSISATTRKKRKEEEEGEDYHFLTEREFKRWEREGRFLEVAKVHNYYYGTPRDMIMEYLSNKKDVIMDIDIQGAEGIREKIKDVVSVFLLPPNMEEILHRIKKRGMNNKEEIKNRLEDALLEIEEVRNFDYVVVNNNLEETILVIKSIIIAERHSIDRMEV
ncbi:guanylate kinase [candidate division WOR-3 bacterium]|nr:guanylate kinase [candidate division WOR-3 bacterium]